MSQHKAYCECVQCEQGIEQWKNTEKEIIRKHGHSVRCVRDFYSFAGKKFPSTYTFGLTLDGFSHEFECVLPTDPKMLTYLLNNLATQQRKGADFKPGLVYHIPELNDVPFYFIETIQPDNGIPLYRVVLADENLLFPGDEGCHPIYALQEVIGTTDEDICC